MIKRIADKRAASDAIWKLITWILVLFCVILAFYFFFYGSDTWNFIKNLPSYGYDKSDQEISQGEIDQLVKTNKFLVGQITDSINIKLCWNKDCSQLQASNLYVTDIKKGGIYVRKRDDSGSVTGWIRNYPGALFNADDEFIGSVIDNTFYIKEDILSKYGKTYENIKYRLPGQYYLLNLNGSMYTNGLIYRESEVALKNG